MFDRFVDIVLEFISLGKFWIVLEPYEQGILLRLGKFVRVLEPGLTWLIPLGVDYVLSESVVPRTHSLPDQSCTTVDGKQIGFQAVITYRVNDIKKALLDVHHHEDAIRDSCAGTIGHILSTREWKEIIESEDVVERVTLACRKKGFRWGLEVTAVNFATLSLCRTLRLLNK
jgi:regulator of protease activity HflC (stomatin/prohibitin superfamily)